MELEDAIHTALLTLMEGYEGINYLAIYRPNEQYQYRSRDHWL